MTIPGKELQEKEFIRNNLGKNPFPAWIAFIVILCIVSVFWGVSSWYFDFMATQVEKNPFLQVTNRQMSLFLWQFPEYMRVNANSKGGYLPGFQYENKVSLFLAEADKYVIAPPEILFMYHTWSRLLKNEFIPRTLTPIEFKEFLQYAEEWQPQNWPQAPIGYKTVVDSFMKGNSAKDLNTLDETEFPLDVQIAFQGWKNFFKEGDAINQLKPTFKEVEQFLKISPNYNRNFWRNILDSTYPSYLKGWQLANLKADEPMPNNEIAPFFRVAIYNYLHSNPEPSQLKKL
jgi:hypothetical protein